MSRSTSYSNPTDFNSVYGVRFYAIDTDQEYISKPFTCADENLIISWDYRNNQTDLVVLTNSITELMEELGKI